MYQGPFDNPYYNEIVAMLANPRTNLSMSNVQNKMKMYHGWLSKQTIIECIDLIIECIEAQYQDETSSQRACPLHDDNLKEKKDRREEKKNELQLVIALSISFMCAGQDKKTSSCGSLVQLILSFVSGLFVFFCRRLSCVRNPLIKNRTRLFEFFSYHYKKILSLFSISLVLTNSLLRTFPCVNPGTYHSSC